MELTHQAYKPGAITRPVVPGSVETNCLGPYNQEYRSQDVIFISVSLAPEPGT